MSLDRSVNIMSSQSESSSSSSSGSDTEEVVNMEADLCNFVPCEKDLEPLATEEEAAEQDARWLKNLKRSSAIRQNLTVKWISIHGMTIELFLFKFLSNYQGVFFLLLFRRALLRSKHESLCLHLLGFVDAADRLCYHAN